MNAPKSVDGVFGRDWNHPNIMADEKEKSDETKSPRDMALDLNFVPTWAREEPNVTGLPKARRRDGGGRERRGGRDRRGGSDRRMENRRGGQGRDRRDAGGSRHRGGDRRSGGDRRGGGQRRDGDRGGRGGRRGRGPREKLPNIGLRVDFIPVRERLNKVAGIIRNTRRAFPLEDIASRFVADASFILVKLQLRDDERSKNTVFYECRADGTPFLNERDCTQHCLAHGLADKFETREIAVDPPTGKFPCIVRCSMCGALIGPPNHHAYKEELEAHRGARHSNLSAEDFIRRTERVHEEEVVEAWKASKTSKTVYVEITDDIKARRKKAKQEKKAEKNDADASPDTGEVKAPPKTVSRDSDDPRKQSDVTGETGEGATQTLEAVGRGRGSGPDPRSPHGFQTDCRCARVLGVGIRIRSGERGKCCPRIRA